MLIRESISVYVVHVYIVLVDIFEDWPRISIKMPVTGDWHVILTVLTAFLIFSQQFILDCLQCTYWQIIIRYRGIQQVVATGKAPCVSPEPHCYRWNRLLFYLRNLFIVNLDQGLCDSQVRFGRCNKRTPAQRYDEFVVFRPISNSKV